MEIVSKGNTYVYKLHHGNNHFFAIQDPIHPAGNLHLSCIPLIEIERNKNGVL